MGLPGKAPIEAVVSRATINLVVTWPVAEKVHTAQVVDRVVAVPPVEHVVAICLGNCVVPIGEGIGRVGFPAARSVVGLGYRHDASPEGFDFCSSCRLRCSTRPRETKGLG